VRTDRVTSVARLTDFIPRRGACRALAALGTAVGAGLAGCSGDEPASPTAPASEGTATVRLRNRDDRDREFEVVANQGEGLTDSFSGVFPANEQEAGEMVATFRITDEQCDFTISTPGGQRGRTWDPTECDDFLVDGFIAGGGPGFDAGRRGN
jgi:hypothetical protein